jgi:hypothetical protein
MRKPDREVARGAACAVDASNDAYAPSAVDERPRNLKTYGGPGAWTIAASIDHLSCFSGVLAPIPPPLYVPIGAANPLPGFPPCGPTAVSSTTSLAMAVIERGLFHITCGYGFSGSSPPRSVRSAFDRNPRADTEGFAPSQISPSAGRAGIHSIGTESFER